MNCPICGTASKVSPGTGDNTIIVCPQCGGYKLAGTAETMLEKGTLKKPDAAKFREIVKRKRGKSTEYPVITQGDLGG